MKIILLVKNHHKVWEIYAYDNEKPSHENNN